MRKDASEPDLNETARDLGVAPELSDSSWKTIAEEFPQKMRPYMEGFTEEVFYSLCKDAEKNAIAGYRSDRLADIIQEHYKVPAAKAEFLASQATSLYMSLFRQLRFREAGVKRYIWRTSGDQRVCKNCARLNGKTFSYSKPPIMDKTTGHRANPGESSNCGESGEVVTCRCIDEPILPRI